MDAEPEAEPEDGAAGGEFAGGEAEAEEEAEIILPPEPALAVMYIGDLGNFLLTLGGIDAKAIYECSFDVPFPLRTVPSHAHAITELALTNDGEYLLSGCEGGVVQIRKVGFIGSTWESKMHDRTYGCIGSVTTSFDGRFLFSAGADSNLFMVPIHFAEVDVSALDLKSGTIDMVPETPGGVPCVDITKATAYSIEEEKQKSEEDAMKAKAEASKVRDL